MDRHGKVPIDDDARWDHRFHIGGPEGSDDTELEDFLREFGDLYHLPPAQRIISRLYPIRPLVHYWNAYLMKNFVDRSDQIATFRRIEAYRESRGLPAPGTRFLLRVDDFPRHDIGIEGFMDFHDIAKEHRVGYLLGVTPFLSGSPLEPASDAPDPLTDPEIDCLREIGRNGVEFGLHGKTHRTLYRTYRTETIGMPRQKVMEVLSGAKRALSDIDIRTEVYVPPYNTIDRENLRAVKGLFKVVTGGPETIPILGMRLSPSSIDGTIHLPVYRPLYDKCKDLARALSGNVPRVKVVPLAVHWSWEVGSGFEHFRRLCEAIGGRTSRWEDALFPGDRT